MTFARSQSNIHILNINFEADYIFIAFMNTDFNYYCYYCLYCYTAPPSKETIMY